MEGYFEGLCKLYADAYIGCLIYSTLLWWGKLVLMLKIQIITMAKMVISLLRDGNNIG